MTIVLRNIPGCSWQEVEQKADLEHSVPLESDMPQTSLQKLGFLLIPKHQQNALEAYLIPDTVTGRLETSFDKLRNGDAWIGNNHSLIDCRNDDSVHD